MSVKVVGKDEKRSIGYVSSFSCPAEKVYKAIWLWNSAINDVTEGTFTPQPRVCFSHFNLMGDPPCFDISRGQVKTPTAKFCITQKELMIAEPSVAPAALEYLDICPHRDVTEGTGIPHVNTHIAKSL